MDTTRYVAFLRAINGGQVNFLSKEDLRLLLTTSGANWADTYITSGNVAFDCRPDELSDIVQRAHHRLRTKHSINQPIIVHSISELVALSKAGVPMLPDPDYIGVMASFLAGPVNLVTKLPAISRRGDIILFEMRGDVALSHRIKVKGTAGDANAFAERLLQVSATSRSWRTVEGIVAKFART